MELAYYWSRKERINHKTEEPAQKNSKKAAIRKAINERLDELKIKKELDYYGKLEK